MIEEVWPDSWLIANYFLSKNTLLCGVITIIYLLLIETECRRTQISNMIASEKTENINRISK